MKGWDYVIGKNRYITLRKHLKYRTDEKIKLHNMKKQISYTRKTSHQYSRWKDGVCRIKKISHIS